MLFNEEAMERFRAYLVEQGLCDKTISDYCTYLNTIERICNKQANEIVSNDCEMLSALEMINESNEISKSSYSSYGSGLRAYYYYVHNRRFTMSPTTPHLPVCAESHWYQEVLVEDVDAWWRFVCRLNDFGKANAIDPIRWAFRGQGYSAWGLESSLGRSGHYGELGVGNHLREYEREALWTFGRESAKSIECRDYTGCDLLALMQHYECKTRLLDFTMSPLVALFMAVDQHESDYSRVETFAKKYLKPSLLKKILHEPDLAVWAVDLNALMSPSGRGNKKNGPYFETVEDALKEANDILIDDTDSRGVIPVFPKICNHRISAQDGLFLMPRSLKCSFEENLRSQLADQIYQTIRLKDHGITEQNNAVVYKFILSATMLDGIKKFLRDANVTAKSIYPDLTGLGRFVTKEIERHEADNDSREA